MNGGFFVASPSILDYIDDDETIFEQTPLNRLSEDGELSAYQHSGFWLGMDTLWDKINLDNMWNSGKAPWKIWSDDATRTIGPMKMNCRHCGLPLKHSFCDLGMSPLANSYLTEDQVDQPEVFFPLHAYVCSDCLLVQVGEFQPPDSIFSEYAYFSSYSQSWLDHARAYAHDVIARFSLDSSKQVIEIASNDGYLLQNFVSAGIPALGIEPAANVAAVAQQCGIATVVAFFGTDFARKLVDGGTHGGSADRQ